MSGYGTDCDQLVSSGVTMGLTADLFAQRRVRPPRRLRAASVQHVKRGRLGVTSMPNSVRNEYGRPSPVGTTHLGVQLARPGRTTPGPSCIAGGCPARRRVSIPKRVAALHTTARHCRTVADLDRPKRRHVGGASSTQFFLILPDFHAGQLRPRRSAVRTGRRDRHPVGLVDLRFRGAAAAPQGHRLRRVAGRDARRALADRSLTRPPGAAWRATRIGATAANSG